MAGYVLDPVNSQLIRMDVREIEWTDMPEAEVQHWFELHPNLESWLPQDADRESVPYFLAFMGWLRIRKESQLDQVGELCVEQIMAMTRGVTADMVWLWMQSENLTKAELYGFIMHAAHLFQEEVRYCLVYHGNTFMAEELKLEGLLDALIPGCQHAQGCG